MDQNKIGKFISKKRREKGLTQTELGDYLKVSYKAVSKWENGKNMPDVSLFKPLCSILNISLNELLMGEENPKNNSTDDILIKTIKNKQKMDILSKTLFVLIIIMTIAIITIMIYVVLKPSNKIKSIDIIASKNKIKEEKIELNNNTIYFYGIKKISFKTINDDVYDLKEALKEKEITTQELNYFLENKALNNQVAKFDLDDDTTIYKDYNYTVIYCSNSDIYIGSTTMQEDLKGRYCGYDEPPHYFTRTYKILYTAEDNDYNYYNALIKQFQGPYEVVKIPRDNYELGSFYEFTFYTYNSFKDDYSCKMILNNSTLVDIKKTDKLGLGQKQEKVSLTK